MLKRSLSAVVALMLTGATAQAGINLFGSIPCLTESCGGETCGDPVCGDDSCCDPGCGDIGCGEAGLCDSLFQSGSGNCLSGLTSLIKPSDHCFDDFISPMTNPVFFEDPRTLTEARVIFANHWLPSGLGGKQAQLYATQLRFALNEDVSIIATKDGFIVSQNPLIQDGWADIAAGLKINVYKDVCSQTLVSVGGTYEAPFGTPKALQGNGDGEFHLFTSGMTKILDDYHYISGLGLRLPVDTFAESTSMYWSNHIDREIGNSGVYLLGECNWYHILSDGGAFPAAVSGLDLFNVGGTGIAGDNIVTLAVGAKYKPSGNTELGVAWETPASDNRDVLDDRLTVDWIIRY